MQVERKGRRMGEEGGQLLQADLVLSRRASSSSALPSCRSEVPPRLERCHHLKNPSHVAPPLCMQHCKYTGVQFSRKP